MKINGEVLGRVLSCGGSLNSTQIGSITPRGGITPRAMRDSPTTPSKHVPDIQKLTSARLAQEQTESPRVLKPPAATGTGPLLISSANDRRDLTYFDLLYTEMGFKNCHRFFQQITEQTKQRLTENQFITIMRDLSDLGDHQIVEIFDAFDHEDRGSIGFREFFFLIALFCALESGNTRHFVYLHQDLIVDIVSNDRDSQTMSWEEFARFAYMMGVSEVNLHRILSEFDIDIFRDIPFHDAIIYYYRLAEDVDRRKETDESAWDSPYRSDLSDKHKQKDCIIS